MLFNFLFSFHQSIPVNLNMYNFTLVQCGYVCVHIGIALHYISVTEPHFSRLYYIFKAHDTPHTRNSVQMWPG